VWGGGCVAIWTSLTKLPTQSREIHLNKNTFWIHCERTNPWENIGKLLLAYSKYSGHSFEVLEKIHAVSCIENV